MFKDLLATFFVRCFFVIFILLGFYPKADANAGKTLSVGDGLPSNRVFDITRDHRGFMWLATEHGIARFDGARVKRFSKHQTPELSNSLWVRDVLFDSQQRLWAAGKQGLEVLNPHAEAFKQVPTGQGATSLNIYSLFESTQGEIWVGEKSGLYKFDNGVLNLVPFNIESNDQRPEQPTFNDRVLSITQVDESTLLMATDPGILLLDITKQQAQFIKNEEGEPLFADKVWRLDDGRIWLSMQGVGLAQYFSSDKKAIVQYVDENQFDTVGYVFDLKMHGDTLLAASLNAGLVQLSEQVIPVGDSPPLLSIYRDEQVLALGSYTEGAVLQHANLSAAQNFAFTHPSETNQFEINDVLVLEQHIWIADQLAGLCRYKMSGTFDGCLKAYDLSAQAIAKGKSNTLWVSLYQELVHLDAESMQVIDKFSFAEMGIPDSIYAMVFENDTSIWLSHSFDGLTQLNPKTRQVKRYTRSNSELLNDQVHSIVQHQSMLWVATSAGLQLLDLTTGEFLQLDSQGPEFSGAIYDLYLSPSGVLFLQSDAGIKAFDTYKKDWLMLPTQIANVTNASVAFSNDGRAWFANGLGIFGWDPSDASDVIHYYDKGDGLYHQGYIGSAASTAHDSLVFASADGLTLFAPKKLIYFDASPKVSEFEITLADGSTQTYFNKLSLDELPYQHASIRFSLTNANFASVSKQQFRYKLEGVSEAWVELGSSRVLMIPKLAHGKYILQLQSTDSNGNWSATTGQFVFSIKTPWYATVWAYIAYVFTFMLSLFVIYHLRVKALKGIQKQLEKEVALQTKAITEQNKQLFEKSSALASAEAQRTLLLKTLSHELMTPVSLIQGPAEQLMKVEHAQERNTMANIVVSNAKRLKVLIEQLMQASGHSGGEVQTTEQSQQLYDLSKICLEQASAFAPLLAQHELRLEVDITPHVMVKAKQDQLEQCVSNLLSNAIKYSPNGRRILLTLNKPSITEPSVCMLSVCDQGIGISTDEQSKIFEPEYRTEQGSKHNVGLGIGLSVVKSTVEALGGAVEVSSVEGQGSTFTLMFKTVESEPITLSRAAVDNETNIDESIDNNSEIQDPHSILIVDDTPDMLTFLQSVFGASYSVTVARDGEEGLELAKSQLPDLIISDVMMPKLDGFGMLSAVKQHSLTAHIPVILLTANLNEQRQIEGLTLRADDYITKPFNLQALELKVRNIFKRQEATLQKWRSRITPQPTQDALSLPALPKLQFKDQPHIYDFLDKLDRVVEQYYRNTQTTVSELAKEMALSERQLHRKLTALISMGANEYLRTYRLYKSITPLLHGGSIAQVADDVGFNSGSYFSACFKKHFGMTAKTFVQKQRDKHSQLN
ncbi:hybrid sensor histidine kinase/response regulator transcription factor [Pseudoalteromonas luteoviolacea]|uniref:histidine kinase n=1 Tax=Pseudoalteromonas luteoviolacea NCIMB 1942 TaxID=1365253 RepID=A0A167G8C1_9GAMM|nr:hybrid sensor histidine kinase/response regulator transcription factor [Pseudoalteromonas luteoviolacea]KZN54309.1 hypothetical protein N482_24565 [Pseudoalteromonas luteoviolacea NCIMB 1942]